MSCQARGEEAYGSAIWDKTTDNVWVPDAYIQTGYSGFATGVPRCNDNSGDIHNFPATSNLDGWNTPSLSATVLEVNQYLSGSQVPVVCQATGGSAYGSTIWDKTVDGVWVSDVYVQTGYSGFATGVPRCTTTSAPTKYNYVARTNLNGRNTTSVSAPVVKVYASGSTITVTCQSIGENAYGSNIWDKTTDELWVTDYYVKTGFDTFVPGLPRCTDNITGSNSGYPTETDLDGRNTKLISAAAVKVYPSGSTINIACQAYGESAYGSYIWDKTSDGLWVTDFYVKTGTSGFISNMPRCDNDPPTGGPTTGGSSTCDTAGHGRNSGPAGSTAGTSAEKIQRVLDLAEHETTLPLSYSWGAGGKGGPDCGIAELSPSGYNDYNRYGFDCSGFTQYIFWAGAGVSIGDNTNSQSVEGTQVSYSNVQKSDLLFWGSPGSTDHVAIYIGNGQIIEAVPPRGTNSVHVPSIYGSHAYAIRMIG